MKNVHIIANEATNASRILKQVKSLSKNGIFDHIEIIALWDEGLPRYERVSENIGFYRIKLITRPLPKNLFFQSIKYLEFSVKSIYFISKTRPNVINAHSLAVLPISLIAKTIFKSSLVYDAHELESERNGLNGIRKKISKIFEKQLIKKVDMTLVVSESIADWYAEEYSIERPPVILNAPNRRKLKTNNHFREKLDIRENQTILLYQGLLTSGRGINLILDAFKLREDDELVVVFMGYGPLEAKIKTVAELHSNIYFFPAVPPQIVLEYTASADVGISLIENSCLSYYYCMPNKLFEYAMTGLPILVSNMKDMSELVINNNMGTVISDFSAIGINKALDAFLVKDLTQMKENAYRIASENAWEVQEQKMISAYRDKKFK